MTPTSALDDIDLDLARRRSLLTSLVVGCAVMLLTFIALALVTGVWPVAAIHLAVLAVLVTPIAVLRRTRSVALAGHLFSAIVLVVLTTLTVAFGGPGATTVALFPLVPMIAVVVIGVRPGVVWCALSAAALTAIYAVDQHVVDLPSRIPPGPPVAELLFVPLVGLASFAILTGLVERSKASMLTALAAARRDAEAASEVKSRFLANMSHEIRTPMNGVLGMAELVLQDELPAHQRQRVEIARQSAEALLSVVNGILDFSKLESGALSLRSQPFDLRRSLDDARATLLPVALQKEIEVEVKVDAACPAVVVGDEHRLRQVVLNLLGNAVKFTARGKVTLVAVARQVADGAPLLELSFVDQGIGIPAGRLARLFEPFSQIDDARTRTHQGTGLGLAIASGIVERMGGSITVDSQPGMGSVFTVLLPLVEGTLPCAEAPRDVAIAPGRRVLVVEDNVVNQKVAVGILQRAGCTCEVAVHGGEALAALDRARFDVVLMDLQMPVMDGFEATRAIRSRPGSDRDVPILALTGDVLDDVRDRCAREGMDGFLSKPLRRTELLAAVHAASHAAEDTAAPAVTLPAPLPAGTIDVDVRGWPTVVVTFVGDASPADFEGYLAALDRLLERGEPYALILDASTQLNTPRAQRERQALWLKVNHDRIERLSRGTAFVLTSPVMRMVLSAILVLQRLPTRHEVFPTLSAARAWTAAQLRAAPRQGTRPAARASVAP